MLESTAGPSRTLTNNTHLIQVVNHRGSRWKRAEVELWPKSESRNIRSTANCFAVLHFTLLSPTQINHFIELPTDQIQAKKVAAFAVFHDSLIYILRYGLTTRSSNENKLLVFASPLVVTIDDKTQGLLFTRTESGTTDDICTDRVLNAQRKIRKQDPLEKLCLLISSTIVAISVKRKVTDRITGRKEISIVQCLSMKRKHLFRKWMCTSSCTHSIQITIH